MKIICEKCGHIIEVNPASIMGKKGGKSKSEKKLKALAENAKKGGWPKGRPRKKPSE